ncbi:MAG: hypothetical protein WCO05_04055 [Candidatus Moraniibacteriota bacterium]
MENINAQIESCNQISQTGDKINRGKNIFLGMLFYLVFSLFNGLIFIVIFKTGLPTPSIVRYLILNDILLATLVSGIVIYIQPAFYLSFKILKDENEKCSAPYFFTKKGILASAVVLLSVYVIGAFVTYGATLLFVPAIFIVAGELFLLNSIYSIFEKNVQIKSNIVMYVSVVNGALIFLLFVAALNAPLITCTKGVLGTNDYECIASKAIKYKNPYLCNKTYSPHSPQYCFAFLAHITKDARYCDYLPASVGGHERNMCKGNFLNSDGVGF